MRAQFSPKDPGEKIVLTFGFAKILDSGETITGATWSVICETATEDTTAMKSGSPVVDGKLVKQTIQGGTSGNRYLHRAIATTSAGRILVIGASQVVEDGL